jgi:hypothetical protein
MQDGNSQETGGAIVTENSSQNQHGVLVLQTAFQKPFLIRQPLHLPYRYLACDWMAAR